MTAVWTSELDEAIDQVLRRASIDADLRQLALSDANAALALFAPRLSGSDGLRFVDTCSPDGTLEPHEILLPQVSWAELELSDLELEEFVGAQSSCNGCQQTCCMCTACCCSSCCLTGAS